MNGADDRRELSALDPRADPQGWEAMVQGINRAAAPEIARRAALPEPGVLALLSEWRRPAAAFCTAVAAAASAILLLQPSSAAEAEGGVAAALGYPRTVASWVETGSAPSVEELLFSIEGDAR